MLRHTHDEMDKERSVTHVSEAFRVGAEPPRDPLHAFAPRRAEGLALGPHSPLAVVSGAIAAECFLVWWHRPFLLLALVLALSKHPHVIAQCRAWDMAAHKLRGSPALGHRSRLMLLLL